MKKHWEAPRSDELICISVNLPKSVLDRVENYRKEQIEKKGKCNRTDAIIDLIIAGSKCEVCQ